MLLLQHSLFANDYRAISLTQYMQENAILKIYKYGWYPNREQEKRKEYLTQCEEIYYDFALYDDNSGKSVAGCSGANKISVVKIKGLDFLILSVVYSTTRPTQERYNIYKILPNTIKIVASDLSPASSKIYKKNGSFYIDTLTSEGMKVAKCNACQKYKVQTYKFCKNSLQLQKEDK